MTKLDLDARCPGIKRIFDQLFDDICRAIDNLTCST